ncbi:MAG TPA: DUF5615 family PIN-like protein [Gemmatimonadaceae bacterium]
MRLLADENVPLASVDVLAAAGHDVRSVTRDRAGSSDPNVLDWARAEERILLTFDRDFGELVFRAGAAAPPGVVFFRLVPGWPSEPAEVLLALLREPGVPLAGVFTVVDRDHVRQRALPGSRPAG